MIYTLPLEKFFSNISFRLNVTANTRKQLNRFLALDFNVFDYIPVNEKNLSYIIGNLLDCKGKHGQENLFFIEFLRLLPPKMQKRIPKPINDYSILYEAPTKNIASINRKIDILVQSSNWNIIIENKPFVGDQYGQLRDYIANLGGGQKCMTIYMPGYHKYPEETSLSKEERSILEEEGCFFIFPYHPKVKEWLENCYRICTAEKVKGFLTDFKNYLNKEFPDHLDTNEIQ
ncbi:MAG: PD-(D/E)XK nuclease family protein [Firmicutes bacterium]|nr:PD-(D/E)XK nuclease family protein [Bacillota bacterium]